VSILYFSNGRQGAIVLASIKVPLSMPFLPIFAAVAGQPCLVVGGGSVAERKVAQLLAAGARVTVNAPRLSPGLSAEAEAGRIVIALRPFDPSLVPLQLLVIAATDDRTVNHAVADSARTALRLCNVQTSRPQGRGLSTRSCSADSWPAYSTSLMHLPSP
jgi:hypothetical protein